MKGRQHSPNQPGYLEQLGMISRVNFLLCNLLSQVQQYEQAIRFITNGNVEAAKGLLQRLLQEPVLQEQDGLSEFAAAVPPGRLQATHQAGRLRNHICAAHA